jgi:hypothetical protein
LDDIYTFLVRGPSSRYPRGYIWVIPVWFAILGFAVVLTSYRLSGHLSLWFGACELGGLALSCLVLLCTLATLRRHAFRVSNHGIWLGIRTNRRRPKLRQMYIPWADLAQMRMAQRHYGTLLEITLGPGKRLVPRQNAADHALLWLGCLFLPLGFGRGRPALTAARSEPPRYLVRLCDVTPAEVRRVLAAVMPPDLGVRIVAKTGTLRFPAFPRDRSQAQPAAR